MENFAAFPIGTVAIVAAALVPRCRITLGLVFGAVEATILCITALGLVDRTVVFIEALWIAVTRILFTVVAGAVVYPVTSFRDIAFTC